MDEGRTAGGARWRLLTPPGAPGAVAIIGIEGSAGQDIDGALRRLGMQALPVGAVALRTLSRHDRALVARWSPTCLQLMPHGGAAVIKSVIDLIQRAGILPSPAPDPSTTYPEARDRLEALMLHALAAAQSPLAVDLLLDQPRRWRTPSHSGTAAAALARLINPPLIVAIGPSNIGKSTLLNALAGRSVSVVADLPGTTRDHVGTTLNLGGLVVRYADTPGFRETSDPAELAALELTRSLAAGADLLVLMGDSRQEPPALDGPLHALPRLTVSLRSDLGLPTWPYDISVCSVTGQGLPGLVERLKARLLGDAPADPRPWRFWEALGMEYGPGEP